MKWYRVRVNLVDPYAIRKLSGCSPSEYTFTVKEKGYVEAFNMILRYDTSVCSYDVGTKVHLRAVDYFEIISVEDLKLLNEHKAKEKARVEAKIQEEREKQHRFEQERIRKNVEFNKSVTIPVKWTTGIKAVLSGLSANSWGDGRNSRSVTHVILKEDFEEGRFKRFSGDLLCSSDSGKFQIDDNSHKNINGVSMSEITCKQCLDILKRKNWYPTEEGEQD